MDAHTQISATIVLYKEDPRVLQKTIACFLNVPLDKKLYILDNSPTNELKQFCEHPNIEYHFFGKNIGFSKAHNWVIDQLKKQSKFHLILNPDVEFALEVIPNLIQKLSECDTVSMIAPRVQNPDGSLQCTCRKNPALFELIARRLHLFKNYTAKRAYKGNDLTKAFFPEFIHGCFMLFKTSDFIALGGFDERYFLYLEDADICRKVYASGKKVLYFPEVSITHLHQKASAKKIKLFVYHILSAIKYAKKW